MQTQFIIYLTLLGITMILGLVKLNRLTSPFRILVLMIGYIFAVELLNRVMVSMSWGNSNPIYHLNSIVLITFTGLIYFGLFDFHAASKRLIVLTSVACGLLALLNSLLYQDMQTFPSFSIAAHAFQSILLALLTFNEMIKSPVQTALVKQSLFWINCGTLVFYSFNFVGFVFFNEYLGFGEIMSWLLYLNWIGNLVLYGSYFIALYLDQKVFHER
jgi:hypothetical protein